ncbi:TRAP-type C4-dicarboxylate transport system, substrate-binding protein [Belnapia rosea]|uniref:TRAP-type C4-dicarboxylate transport system, substrate-binding protein n=2 Tax=Belnapia rosea TaxID=938405 RepID=A0A1G6SYM9_9PROT|nr:TRAP-type C4-dicarboxylate transport system, substrate-binding protein [Belnapia rosea]
MSHHIVRYRIESWMAMARRNLTIAAALLLPLALNPASAEETSPIHLRIAGGLGGVIQYTQYEAPFWTEEVPRLTEGRVRAEIAPFDQSGIRGTEMLSFMRLGVVPFGTLTLAVAAGDEPEMGAMDLPALNPNINVLQQSVTLLRPRLEELLRDRYNVQLLAVYTYPAQVMFCRDPFTSLDDLSGRRIRTSSVGQSELMQALGAIPVVISFSGIVKAINDRVVECAITGSMSGNSIGLQAVTSTVSRQAISWGISFFGANMAAWRALPPEIRSQLQAGLQKLESRIWQVAQQQTENGFACNAGLPSCTDGTPGRMVVLDDSVRDQRRRDALLRDTVLPKWIQRCGSECAEVWNRYVAPTRGIVARAD